MILSTYNFEKGTNHIFFQKNDHRPLPLMYVVQKSIIKKNKEQKKSILYYVNASLGICTNTVIKYTGYKYNSSLFYFEQFNLINTSVTQVYCSYGRFVRRAFSCIVKTLSFIHKQSSKQ